MSLDSNSKVLTSVTVERTSEVSSIERSYIYTVSNKEM
jgi:hypothetical protein